jgi:hypothetical protein
MTEDLEIRLVVAFEQIAEALTGIYETGERQFAKQWPERKEVREAVVTRIPSEEDRIREQHGSGDEPTEQWLTLNEEEAIGEREREFLDGQRREADSGERAPAADAGAEPDRGSAEAVESEA